MRFILFWTGTQPDVNIDSAAWAEYTDLMGGAAFVAVLITVAAILLLYNRLAARRLILRHTDVFRPYTPMATLWLAVAPAAILAALAWSVFHSRFGQEGSSYLGGALLIGLWAGLLSYAIAAIAIFAIPNLTSDKHKYRPFGWIRKFGLPS